MLIGIIGAPNKGKSTLFSAMTLHDAQIANYPFTTIDPNKGVAYATVQCAEKSLGVHCHARNSMCVNGVRMLPVNVIDVAGLVEDAHEGKGMGNQFLGDIAAADALIIVVDATGRTDAAGNPCDSCDPAEDVAMVKNELVEWVAGIISSHMHAITHSKDGLEALEGVLTGLKLGRDDIAAAAAKHTLPLDRIEWNDDAVHRFAEELLFSTKRFVIVANKYDGPNAEKNFAALKEELGEKAEWASAAIELALRKAAQQGVISYVPGAHEFSVVGNDVSSEQRKALDYMAAFIKGRGTNVQNIVNRTVFELLDSIVVYPVEDENKYTDHFGNVLPDAVLMKRGSTAHDLAAAIHTDIAKGMLYAIDARTKMRLAKNYALKDGDVIKIVSAAR